MRKLVTIRRISALLPIEGADLIVTAVIDGWTVVVKKDQFSADDHCVYFEIDSFLPDGNPVWQHLVDKQSRIFEGKKGPIRDAIALNAAIAIAAFKADFNIGITQQIANGYVLAQQAIDSGKAAELLENWSAYTQEISPANIATASN